MRVPATALIATIAVALFSCSPLFASDFDPFKSLSSSLSAVSSGINNGIQRVGSSYNSWTAQNRAAMPQMAAQWDHYTSQFGAVGAPLFVIGQVTNPIMTRFTGVQPGSMGAKQWGQGVNSIMGGIVNLPMKVFMGRDLANPDASPLRGWNRITSITPTEVLQYGLFVGAGSAIAEGSSIIAGSSSGHLLPAFISTTGQVSIIRNLGCSAVMITAGPFISRMGGDFFSGISRVGGKFDVSRGSSREKSKFPVFSPVAMFSNPWTGKATDNYRFGESASANSYRDLFLSRGTR